MTRQDVVDAVKAAIRGLGVPAFEWVAHFEPSDLPAVVMRDTDAETTDVMVATQHALTVEVDCYTSSGPTTIDDCRALMGQVASALAGVQGWSMRGSSLSVQHEQDAIARGTVTGVVRYSSSRGQV